MAPGKSQRYNLKCPECSTLYDPRLSVFKCEKCSAPTVIAMNLSETTELSIPDETTMWRYFNMLPVEERSTVISQGEGLTPLLESPSLAEETGIYRVLLKIETMNPTGSFKDRQISVGITKAKESGVKTIAVVSSGNVAAASASYAAVAGIRCNIFAPINAPEEKLIQARMYGATFFKVNTPSSSRIFKLVINACDKNGWHLLSTAGLYNPYQVEGAKTIAYELFEHADRMPDWVIAPVGGGGLIGALWRGFNELRLLGKCNKSPAIVGVQSSACTPLVNAIENDLSPAQVISNPVSVGNTIAGAIADDILFDAYTALPAIRETGGLALSVTDDEMLAAEKLLAQQAGIFAEPASAATVAALTKMNELNLLKKNDSVCCIITGSGFKDMVSAETLVEAPITIEPTEEAFLNLNEQCEVKM
jgi:threonine synthase